jgi:hypothetical protein
MVNHRAEAQDTDTMLLFDHEKDSKEYQEVPSRMEQDDTIDRSLIDVVDGRGTKSSFSHRFN